MFGIFGDIVESVVETAVDTVDNFVSDPIGSTTRLALQPAVDTLDLIDGLTEFEFREKAALRLGADVVAGMAISEVIDAMDD